MAVKQTPKLPFTTEPQQRTVTLGNDRIGRLTFPVYGDLTVNEQTWLVANGAEKTAFSYTSVVALKIANQERIEPIVAHTFVARVLAMAMKTPGIELEAIEREWMVKYVKELEHCAVKVLEITTAQQNTLVTCMIRHRLEGMEDWLPSDTTTLSSELCEEIMKFAQIEQSRGEFESEEEQTEALKDLLGKQLKEPSMTTPSTSTGESSITSSETSTPETPTSPGSDSDGSPPDTSPSA